MDDGSNEKIDQYGPCGSRHIRLIDIEEREEIDGGLRLIYRNGLDQAFQVLITSANPELVEAFLEEGSTVAAAAVLTDPPPPEDEFDLEVFVEEYVRGEIGKVDPTIPWDAQLRAAKVDVTTFTHLVAAKAHSYLAERRDGAPDRFDIGTAVQEILVADRAAEAIVLDDETTLICVDPIEGLEPDRWYSVEYRFDPNFNNRRVKTTDIYQTSPQGAGARTSVDVDNGKVSSRVTRATPTVTEKGPSVLVASSALWQHYSAHSGVYYLTVKNDPARAAANLSSRYDYSGNYSTLFNG